MIKNDNLGTIAVSIVNPLFLAILLDVALPFKANQAPILRNLGMTYGPVMFLTTQKSIITKISTKM